MKKKYFINKWRDELYFLYVEKVYFIDFFYGSEDKPAIIRERFHPTTNALVSVHYQWISRNIRFAFTY